jgi:predicted permease
MAWLPRGIRWAEGVAQDVRLAVRFLAKERWFSVASIGALALGIGVTSMLVTLINGTNLRGLLVNDAEQVFYIGTRDQSGREHGVSHLEYWDWQTSRNFSRMAAFASARMTIRDQGQSPESLDGVYVSHGAFDVLGERPILGRGFLAEDDQPGAAPVAILGYRLWTSRYGADPTIVGRLVAINGVPATVVGIMREGFEFPFRHGLWQPLALLPGITASSRDERALGVFGRLAEGISSEQARAELAVIATNVAREDGKTNDRLEPVVMRFGVQQVGSLRATDPPVVLLGTALIVLLVACANVANLLLARSATRGREMAIRASVGASRWRIVRQLLVESLLLSLVAGGVGIGISRVGVQFVADAFGRNVPYWTHFPVDTHVLAIVVGLCLACTFVFGGGPALVVSRADLNGLLKEGGRTGIAPRTSRWMPLLVIVEFSVTLVLLSGAGLMVRSVLAVYSADRVIDPSHVLTMEIALPEGKYQTPEQRSNFYRQLDDRLSRTAGPGLVTIASSRPFTGAPSRQVGFREHPTAAGDRWPSVGAIAVGPRYFDTLQVPLVRGRYFNALDGTAGHQTAIVNQRFAELFYANQSPIGRVIRLSEEQADMMNAPWVTIVGVSPTIRHGVASGTRPIVYLPLATHDRPSASIVVGRLGDMTGIVPLLRREVASSDPDVTLFNIRPLQDVLDDSRLQPRLLGTIIAVFATIALVLSVVGVYTLTAHAVQQRTHEIGVRMALGAQPREVVWLFVRRGMLPLGIGLIAGLLGTFLVGRLLQGLLIDTSPTDLLTLAVVVALLVVGSVTACLLPARKAANLDPLAALRAE